MLVNSIKTKNNFHNYIVIKQSDNTSAIEILLCGANGSILSDLNQSCTLTILDEVDGLIRQKTKEEIVNGTVTFRVVNDLKTNPHTLEITTSDGQKFPSNHDFKIFVSYTHDKSELNVINNLSRDEALAEINQSVKEFISKNTSEYVDKVATSEWLKDNEFKPKEAVASFSELPKNAELKEIRLVIEENKQYIFDGLKWLVFGFINANSISNLIETNKKLLNRTSGFVNVKEFGVIGDGVVDDTLNLQKAFDFASLNNKGVFFPKGTYINDSYIKISNNNSIHIEGYNAVIFGKGFSVENSDAFRLTGLKIKSKNKTSQLYDDAINLNKVKKVNISNNVFDGNFIRIRNDDLNFKNELLKIENNLFSGDVGEVGNSSYGNVIEIYGYQNIYITENIFNTVNLYRIIKLSSALNYEGVIKDVGYNNNVYINKNVFRGSIRNKQVIDCFVGIDNLTIKDNIFETKNASFILDTKNAAAGTSTVAKTLRNVNIENNFINVKDETMTDLFRVFSFKFTEIDNDNIETNATFINNKVVNDTQQKISTVDFRGFSNVICANNTLNNSASTGMNVISTIVVYACKKVNIYNNIITNGGITLSQNGSSSNTAFNYFKSPEYVSISNNQIINIKQYAGINFRGNDNIKCIIISNNLFSYDKVKENYVLGNIYLRETNVEKMIISNNVSDNNDSVYDKVVKQSSNVIKNLENNNTWN